MYYYHKNRREDDRDEQKEMVKQILSNLKVKLERKPHRPVWNDCLQKYVEVR